MRRRAALALAGLVGLAALALLPRGSPVALVGPYPGATLGVRRPPFLLLPAGGEPARAALVAVDGTPVRAALGARRDVRGILPELAPGRHRLDAFFLAPRVAQHLSWRIAVAPTAIAALPRESAASRGVRAALSAYRVAVGSPPLAYDPSLEEAARRHALYFARHAGASSAVTESAHDETPGAPGFVGRGPLARDTYYGFPGDEVSEVMAFGASAPSAPPLWLDSVYHRLGILDPNLTAVGFGESGGAGPLLPVTVADLGCLLPAPIPPTRAVVCPADGAQGVPLRFEAGEVPDPLAAFRGAHYPLGFPVTVSFFSWRVATVSGVRASLLENGRPVPFHLLTPEDDPNASELGATVALLKTRPLAPHARYVFRVALTVVTTEGERLPFRTQGSFRTA